MAISISFEFKRMRKNLYKFRSSKEEISRYGANKVVMKTGHTSVQYLEYNWWIHISSISCRRMYFDVNLSIKQYTLRT